MTLERALQNAASDASALVDAWKLNPHPRIAAVLRQLPASALFTELFEGKLAEVANKIAVLKIRQHPHLSDQLERVLREPPWSSNGSRAVWGQIFSLVAASKDPRFVALARELPAKWAMRSDQKTWMTEALRSAVVSIPEVVALTEEQSALLQAIEREAFSVKPPPKRSATIDFAAVYASPRDDAPRLVLADALLEQGDPRGEFLSLQLRARRTPADLKREKTLLKTYSRLWLAPFGTALGADVKWRRGFPAQGLVKFRDAAEVGKYGALPEWATFEALTWSPPRSPEHSAAAGFIGPAFRHLLRAEDVHLPHLLENASTRWALTWVRGQVESAEGLGALLRHPGLGKLQSLHLTDPGFNAEWLKATTHWGPLQELGTAAPYPLLLHVLAAAEASPLARLQWGEALRFHRAPDGSLTRLELLDWRGAYRVDEQLLSLPEGALSLMAPPDKNWSTGPVGRALERATAKRASRPSLAGSAARHLGLNSVLSMAWAGGAVWVSDGRVSRRVDARTLEVSGPSRPGGLLAEHDVLFQRGDQLVLRELATSAERTVVELRGLEKFQRSADGRRLAVVKGSKVRVYEVATGELCFQCAGRDPVFDFRGRRLLVRVGPVRVVHDLESKTKVVLESGSSMTCFLADERLAQRDRLGPVRVWRPGGEVLQLPALPDHHWAASSTADGARLAVVQPGSTQLFDGRTGQPLGQYPGGRAGLFAPDGHFYVASNEQLTMIEVIPES